MKLGGGTGVNSRLLKTLLNMHPNSSVAPHRFRNESQFGRNPVPKVIGVTLLLLCLILPLSPLWAYEEVGAFLLDRDPLRGPSISGVSNETSLQIDLERFNDGIQNTLNIDPNDVIQASLVVNGVESYSGYVIRILVNPAEAVSNVTFVSGNHPESGGTRATSREVQPSSGKPVLILEDTVPPSPFRVDGPSSTLFGFDITLSEEIGNIIDIHIIEVGELGLPTEEVE